jgi:two-component system cell cycle sensor histidine kinase/response regulator CckA
MEPDHAAPSRDPARPAARILVVDDHDDVRRVMVRALERRGFHVHQAANGAEAVALAERLDALELLVTDIEMPVLKGGEAAERIRARFPDVPVLFVSGYTTDGSLRERIRRGEVRFLAKPFDVRQFLGVVDELLDGR